jgi:deoxyadenosine/deoxycytidine kinase
MIISFDSNIGGGKSTQLSMLSARNSDNYVIWQEELDKWISEGWLDHFYQDMNKFSLGFQMRVFYSQIERYQREYKPLLTQSSPPIVLTERSPFTCHRIFGEMLVRDSLMSPLELDLCNKYNTVVGWMPDYGIYIQTSPETSYERIQHRQRNSEKKIGFEYIRDLHEEHERKLLEQDLFPVFAIDGNRSTEDVYMDVVHCLDIIKSRRT